MIHQRRVTRTSYTPRRRQGSLVVTGTATRGKGGSVTNLRLRNRRKGNYQTRQAQKTEALRQTSHGKHDSHVIRSSEPQQECGEAASLLATMLSISQPRYLYNHLVYIRGACPREKMLLIFVATFPVKISQRVLQLEVTQSNQPLLISSQPPLHALVIILRT